MNNFNLGDVVRVTEGVWSGTAGCVIGVPAGLPDNVIPEITVELHPYGHKIVENCRADWLEPIQIPTEATPDDFKVGDRIMVSGNAKAYKGAYAFVLGCIIQLYNKTGIGKNMYGVRLDDRDNPKSANGLFWFHKNELLHVCQCNKLKIGEQVAVSADTLAYDRKYNGLLGRVIRCYKRNSTGEKMYGVRLDSHHNSMSGFNDLFWFREDELLHAVDNKKLSNALKSIRKAVELTNPNPEPSLVEKVIVNGPKTIVFWNDGTKTIVSCREGEEFDIYTAFCAALAKKMFGSTSRVKAILEDKLIIQEKKDKKKTDDLSDQTNCSLDNLLVKEIANLIEEFKKMFPEVFDHD